MNPQEITLTTRTGMSLYQAHRAIYEIMREQDNPQAERDFLFEYDPLSGLTYVRTSRPREALGAWSPVPVPQAGQTYNVSGRMAIQRCKSRYTLKPTSRGPIDWMQPAWLQERISSKLSACGTIERVQAKTTAPVLFDKPGSHGMLVTPITFTARMRVDDPQAAADLLDKGMGWLRGFGFGVMTFAPETA